MSSVLISENSSCHIKLFFKKIWQVLIIVLLLHSLSGPEVVRRRDETSFFDRIKINREVVQEARYIFIYVPWVEETSRSIILERFCFRLRY